MKSPTRAYAELKKTLGETKRILGNVPHTECTTTLHHLKVKSYILLSHAAFEVYLENLARDICSQAIDLLNSQKIITKTIVCLTAYETIVQLDTDNARKRIKSEVAKDFNTFANAAKSNLIKQIDSNHGIRKENQKSLLVPIGVDPEEVDLPTFSALDSLGIKRGNFAHKTKLIVEETRSSIIRDTDTIRDGLKEYDMAACDCLKTRMSA